MMDVELLPTNEIDQEDGELTDTSEEVYTPLQRPISLVHNATATANTTTIQTASKCTKMDADGGVIDDDKIKNMPLEDECQSDDYDDEYSTSSGDLSDVCIGKLNKEEKKKTKHKKRHIKRTVMVRIQQQPSTNDSSAEQKKARFKKYNIWTAALQEDALTENMRGCDVTKNVLNDRNVENYDFTLNYRLNGENSLKRRLSNSNDDLSDSDQYQHQSKRQRHSSRRSELKSSTASSSSTSSRRSVHERLGKRRDFYGRRHSSPYSGGSDSNSYDPKNIEDLMDINNRYPIDVAKEMATKLQEEKDDLLVRAVKVLGLELPLEIYKETQRIEAEGGMTIKNGQRRRTPGGVFLFLLKHHDSLTAEDRKAIFAEDRQKTNKKLKDVTTIIRDRKVEELKKRLCEQGVEIPTLGSRKDLIVGVDEAVHKQNEGNLSNPPPSPEACEQIELDLKTIPINHVTNDDDEGILDKPSTSHGSEAAEKELQAYEDDFLDVNCGDMDFF